MLSSLREKLHSHPLHLKKNHRVKKRSCLTCWAGWSTLGLVFSMSSSWSFSESPFPGCLHLQKQVRPQSARMLVAVPKVAPRAIIGADKTIVLSCTETKSTENLWLLLFPGRAALTHPLWFLAWLHSPWKSENNSLVQQRKGTNLETEINHPTFARQQGYLSILMMEFLLQVRWRK